MARPAAAKAPYMGAAGCYQGQLASATARTGSSPKGGRFDRPFEGWLLASKGNRRLRRGDVGGIVSVREEG
ncbi:hypothetical protein B296_00049172 [Ensete ventricosum]|uniref:Uncharacterized protein n=1 Tax=Ensete ventricosum TaxID=4639 RepID=A0A426Y0J0_ENSVE|nr:hypothetical protein B296_00049172 [Ensete ventricosum]